MVILIILVVVLTILFVIFPVVVAAIQYSEEGAIIEESIIVEYLEKHKQHIEYVDNEVLQYIYLGYPNYKICRSYPRWVPSIFPYYIQGVGVIPVWYGVTRELNKVCKNGSKNSSEKIREKLGLK
jgi:hypothetical protein